MSASPSAPAAAGWRLEHRYAALPASLYRELPPTPVAAPRLVVLNTPLAVDLGLDPAALATPEGVAWLAGNALPPGARPLAQAYAGHQYAHFTLLGDGRALLLGEQRPPAGDPRDIQLKGAGPTPYSRRGDGRAALGPMLREYLIGEAMHALGIPTTRALAVVATGEEVWREVPLPGAVLTRVAASHVRVGTYQYAAARRDETALRALVDHTLRRHYPARADAPHPALALLRGAIERQAALIARWLHVGFVHGVMNTDNMALSGETIDYGPCAFLDAYEPDRSFSSIDRHGRYAYARQPAIALWNLTRLAETLLPLLDPIEARAIELAQETLATFEPLHRAAYLDGLRAKLGLVRADAGDEALGAELLAWMARTRADFTNTFADLAAPDAEETPPATLAGDEEFTAWRARWRARCASETTAPAERLARRRAACPAIIPRNHRVEEALAAAGADDLAPLQALLANVTRPFDHDHPSSAPFREPPSAIDAEHYCTFCGT
jgi:serine/tyrosine/threonine adenylyltransferase